MFENFDIEVCQVFKEAERQREVLRHEYVGTEHLLLAILKNKTSFVDKLKKYGLSYESFLTEVKYSLNSSNVRIKNNIYTPLLKRIIVNSMERTSKVTIEDLIYSLLDEGEGVAIRLLISMNIDVDMLYNQLKERVITNSELELYKMGTLLNESVNINEKVISREKELDLIMETLLRKKKNNPLLIGDAGVGKSAIVEELTRKIINGEVPEGLLDTKIVMLEMGQLVAGTRYRGEFEEKLMNIITEIKNHKNVVLFIDEIHSMVNAGAADGAISASDILKPYLARGDIKCIGATTRKEYEKYFSSDKALMRRFETIWINEPTEEQTINIVKKVKNEYVNYHKVNINDEVIEVLVHLACVYFPNKKNPDKSLELLDSVMSYVKLKEGNTKIKDLELNLHQIEMQKIREVEHGNFKDALKNNQEENRLKKEIKKLRVGKSLSVKKEDIIDVLEYKNNIIISEKKIKNIAKDMNDKYNKKIIKKLSLALKNKFKATTLLIKGNAKSFIEDLSESLSYNIFYLNETEKIPKLFDTIKYNPSLIIVIDNLQNYQINNLLKSITKDNMVEYQDEYINFSNSLIVLSGKNNLIGFESSDVSPIPIDEIISFDEKVSI